ncbi:hypothetical protein MKW92_034610 [Papaver armeniacum]|nr:hypothetical protein MKW92_034610 [Papaver armeniacum]
MAILYEIVALVFPAIVNAQSTHEPAMAPTSDGFLLMYESALSISYIFVLT